MKIAKHISLYTRNENENYIYEGKRADNLMNFRALGDATENHKICDKTQNHVRYIIRNINKYIYNCLCEPKIYIFKEVLYVGTCHFAMYINYLHKGKAEKACT